MQNNIKDIVKKYICFKQYLYFYVLVVCIYLITKVFKRKTKKLCKLCINLIKQM